MTTAAVRPPQPARPKPESRQYSATVAIPLSEFGKSLGDADLDQWFEAFCERNVDRDQYEISSSGDLLIMPPTGQPGVFHETKFVTALEHWSETNGGFVYGPTCRFHLPDGSRPGPDAAWVREERQQELMREENRPFATFAPDFVAEIKSPSNSVAELIDKINLFIEHGTRLAWLLNTENRTVTKFRPGQEPETLRDPEFVDGDADVLPGFRFAVRARIFDYFTNPQ